VDAEPDPAGGDQDRRGQDQGGGRAAVSEPPAGSRRGRFYLYCRQNGLWPREVAGHDPDTEPRAFDRFCPVRNVSPQYPPTLLIHGTNDTDVPHEQSVIMDRELSRQGVPHEFLSVPDGGHGLGNIDRAKVEGIYRQAVTFIERYMH